jgi:hypothetical protein
MGVVAIAAMTLTSERWSGSTRRRIELSTRSMKKVAANRVFFSTVFVGPVKVVELDPHVLQIGSTYTDVRISKNSLLGQPRLFDRAKILLIFTRKR